MSRHRTNQPSFVDGRYRGSGGASPGWVIHRMVAPAAILAANSGAGMIGPPTITAGAVWAGPVGFGITDASARVISLTGFVGLSGSSPSSTTGVSSVRLRSSAITLITTALAGVPAAAQSSAPHPHTSRSAPAPNAPNASARR
jgi:hypothetical protein